MCEIDDKPTEILVDTGSNRKIVNKHFVNYVNKYGTPFYTNVRTADGKRANSRHKKSQDLNRPFMEHHF